MILPIYFEPYEDELFYSWMHRIMKANDINEKGAIKTYFGDKLISERTIANEGVFWKLTRWQNHPDFKDILYKHSTFITERVIEKDCMTASYIHAFLYNTGDSIRDTYRSKNSPIIRICLKCIEEDREKGIPLYIKTWHCFKNVKVCKKHGCELLKIKGYPNKIEYAKETISEENSLDIAKAMYEIYENPDNVRPEFLKRFRKKDYHEYKTEDTDELKILTDYGFLVKAKCKTCGMIFYTSAYAVSIGRDCPECEKNQDIIQKMMTRISGYSLVKPPKSMTDAYVIRHDVCGSIMGSRLFAVLWNKGKCQCELKFTPEEVKKRAKLKDFDVLQCSTYDKGWMTILRHKKCGTVFEAYVREGLKCQCPACMNNENEREKENYRLKREAMFDKRVKELVGDEYIRVSRYIDNKTSLQIMHRKCGTIFESTPYIFTHMGKRCPKCRKRLTKNIIIKALNEFENTFTILNYPNKHEKKYVIKFNDTGEVRRMSAVEIYQEVTCLCEPKYFKRKKKRIKNII